jgi:hypothetical protein
LIGLLRKTLLCAVKFITKMMYLVNCEVVKSYYMDDTKKSEMNHIVEAESEQEAMDKVQDFYSKKDSEFYISHWVNFNYCNEVIS